MEGSGRGGRDGGKRERELPREGVGEERDGERQGREIRKVGRRRRGKGERGRPFPGTDKTFHQLIPSFNINSII